MHRVDRKPPFRALCATILVLASALGGAPAVAGSVPVPSGFKVFCEVYPQECRGGGARSVKLTDALMGTLEHVNAEWNAAITPVKNEGYDLWSINVTKGDCEEYVLAKRRALINIGVPASALSIVYALRNGGGHAVLGIHTDKGIYVLDNMTRAIKLIGRTGYKIVSMSGPNPKVWVRA
jgi:predicted transglutaminase-like cysteine proteinase